MAVNSSDGPFVFRLNENGIGPHLLAQVCTERGWREYISDNAELKDRWNLWWKSGGFTNSHYKSLLPWQFINRIPKGNSICRKNNLVRHLKCMKKIHGSIYDFSPLGYNLPLEYTKLAAECSRTDRGERVWICKPVGQSQGKGIFLFRKLSDLIYDNVAVVQRYIENPLLIGGYKFDLRLYVCVPSYQPLAIYIYKEGLVRFATQKFSLDHLDDPFRHLTNCSLNKMGPGYSEKKERIGAGCKWTLRQLRRYFSQSGYHDWLLWQRIACLVSLTILSQAAGIPRSSNCFEFFGFDVLIDDNLKPWLLEVNISPALGNDCEVDAEVKKPLLHDLFDLLGLPIRDTGLSLFTMWTRSNEEDDSEQKCFHPTSKMQCKPNGESLALVKVCSIPETLWKESTSQDDLEVWSRNNTLFNDKTIPKVMKNNYLKEKTLVWDNGRDWRNPSIQEGGWIRIHPTNRKESFDSCTSKMSGTFEKEAKDSVLSIQKYLKIAMEVHRKCTKQSDDLCNKAFYSSMELDTAIWLPEK